MSPQRLIWYINKAYWTMLITSQYIVKTFTSLSHWPFPNWYFKLKTIKITLFNNNLWYGSLQIVRHENKVYLYHAVEGKKEIKVWWNIFPKPGINIIGLLWPKTLSKGLQNWMTEPIVKLRPVGRTYLYINTFHINKLLLQNCSGLSLIK